MTCIIRSLLGAVLGALIAAAMACANPGAPAATATPVPAAAAPTTAPTAAATPTPAAATPTPAAAVPTPAAATPPTAPTAPTATPTPAPMPTATPTLTPISTPRPTATPRNSGGGVRDALRSSSCRVSSQNKIAWEQKPTLTADGYLVMSGRAKGEARIHDPTAGATGGLNWPAFNLNNLRESSGLRLEAVGSIYPGFMASRLGPGSTPNIFAYDDDYRATATEFYVRAKLPASLLSRNIRLVVVVWPANPGFQSPALSAECVRPE